MVIERTKNEVIIRLPAYIDTEGLQNLIRTHLKNSLVIPIPPKRERNLQISHVLYVRRSLVPRDDRIMSIFEMTCNYLTYKEATDKSQAKQQDVDKLAKDIKKGWWNKNRNRFRVNPAKNMGRR